MKEKVILEKSANEIIKKTSTPPFIYELPVNEGREVLENLQKSYVYKYPAKISVNTVNIPNKNNSIPIYITTPLHINKLEHVIFYIHGAGWVYGSFNTHEKLVRELAYKTNSVVIFPEYSRSPEAKTYTAMEECYYILNQTQNILKTYNLTISPKNLIVAGDSVGGNLAIDMVLLSKYNNGPKIDKLLLYYPVVDDNFNTHSYLEFEKGYYLSRDEMIWFWNNYAPNQILRNNILITPLKASLQQLKDFPNTLIINGEADVLRDEGELFAKKLRKAGNNVTQVTIQGTIHDFVMLNSLDQSNATRTAMDISTSWINKINPQ